MRKSLKKLYIPILLIFFSPTFTAIKFSGTGGSLNLDQTNSSLALSTALNDFNGILKIRTAAGAEDNVVGPSSNINFTSGTLQLNANATIFTGAYVPGATTVADTITLNNNDILEMFAGDTLSQTVTVAASSTATISGATIFANAITLTGASSTLNLGLRHKLNQDITLNSGKIVLLDDLSLKDGIRFLGTGTVDLDRKSLKIGASNTAWTNPVLTFNNAQDIQLNGRTALTGTWSFQTTIDTESIINGNGNVLDLSGGGVIQVGSGHTLYISDVHIKGVGGANGFDLFDHATTPGVVVLSKVTIELASNYIHDSGKIQIAGDLVTVISGGAYTFTVAGANTYLNVDGVALYYETLGGTNTSPFIATTGTINTTNAGVIRSTISDTQPVDIVVDAVTETTRTFTRHIDLRTIEKIVVTNSASPTAHTVTIDGSNYIWEFPMNNNSVITVANNTTVTLTNVILKNFNFAKYTLGTGSALRFGDGVIIELGEHANDSINNSSKTFNCVGNLIFRGFGKRLEINNGGLLFTGGATLGAEKTLTFENTELLITDSASINCTEVYSKIKLKNSSIVVKNINGAAGFTYGTGSIDIEGNCAIEGFATDATDGIVKFDWTSTGTLTIKSGATLKMNRGLNFQYKPAILGTHNNWADSKRHLKMEDYSSTLFCDGCTITSTATGLALDRGNLLINNRVLLTASTNNTISPTGTYLEAAELGSALNIEIFAASLFDLDGNVQYSLTS